MSSVSMKAGFWEYLGFHLGFMAIYSDEYLEFLQCCVACGTLSTGIRSARTE